MSSFTNAFAFARDDARVVAHAFSIAPLAFSAAAHPDECAHHGFVRAMQAEGIA
jgi:hypothetical protein